MPTRPESPSWTLSDLERLRDKVESYGLILDMIQLPLPSNPIEQASYPDILLAGPERDRQIDAVCKLIEDVAAAGIPAAKYNLNLIGIPAHRKSWDAAARSMPASAGTRRITRQRPALPVSCRKTKTGNGSTISLSASFPLRRAIASASPAIRMTPIRRRAIVA